MLATEILTQDHRMAISLIEELEGVENDEPGHETTFTQLDEALRQHMRAEEEIYYPALAQHDEFSDIIDENVPEHEMVKENFAQMRELSVTNATFQSILAETKAALQEHMDNEEANVFPESIEVLGSLRLEELGDQIEQLKGDAGISRSARF